jgi:regulator of replication initiation timing
MTQKQSKQKLSSSELLQEIDPKRIAQDDLRQQVQTLLNLIEQLHSKVKELEKENQRLKDENNRLKGEQGRPEIKGENKGEKKKNYSSEKERKTSIKKSKSSKNKTIKINREEIVDYPEDQMPEDVIFKGYEEVIVQDIKLVTDNIKFRKKKYYSPTTGKTYLGKLPSGYEGQFGPGIKSLIISLYYGGNMTQSKLGELLKDIGISISAGQISNILIKNHSGFREEKTEVYNSGLTSSPWANFDQTGSRVRGKNFTTNVICNP